MQAVIMAGGKGTRLKSITSDIPKPMIPILNKPILEYQIESLKRSNIRNITLVVGHLGEIIEEYFGDGSRWDVAISYIYEDKPLGTAGSLYYLKRQIEDDFILLFGDLVLDVDWNRFMAFHKEKGGLITLYGHPNAHPYDSDVIITNSNSQVQRIESKNEERKYYYHNFVNAGIYCVNCALLNAISSPKKLDLEKQLIADQIPHGTVYAYKSTEYVKDMGTPDRLSSVSEDLKKGIVESRSLKNKQKCIFLDRDGTVNVLKGFLKSADQFELLPDVADAIRMINASEYLVIVATNQPVIARGECSFEEMSRIHMKMETELGKQGAYLDDIFFCPHHPHKGYAGEVAELKHECNCRKPRIGMLLEAADKYNIDLFKSWYMGDTTTDIQTGINAGTHTVLVRTGEAGKDGKYGVKAEYEKNNLIDAVQTIFQSRDM